MKWLTRNVALGPPMEAGPWRNLSIATWKSVSEATVHAAVEVDAERVLAFMKQESARTGVRITMLHCVAKALGEVVRAYPDVNCLLRLGRLYRRKHVDFFITAAMDSRGRDLSGIVVRSVDEKPLAELARTISREAYALRKKGDDEFKRLKGSGPIRRMFSRLTMRMGGFVLYSLNLWSPLLGLPRDAFGGAAITDVSGFGGDHAFPPILPIARLPLLVTVGPVAERCVPEDGRCTVRKRLGLSLTFDHRVLDGVYAGRMVRRFKKIFANPEKYLGEETQGQERAAAAS